MSDLKQAFEDALAFVKTADGDIQPSNEMKLDMYALFKQATEGDVSGTRPGMMDFVGRAKYDAWAKLKGLSNDEAMRRYIKTIADLKKRLDG